MDFGPHSCGQQWDQPQRYPTQISRTTSSDEAPRVADLVLLHSSFGPCKERTTFANNMRRQIQVGMVHLNDLMDRINCEFALRRSDLLLSVRTASIKVGMEIGAGRKLGVPVRSIEFILLDQQGATIDSVQVSGPAVC